MQQQRGQEGEGEERESFKLFITSFLIQAELKGEKLEFTDQSARSI